MILTSGALTNLAASQITGSQVITKDWQLVQDDIDTLHYQLYDNFEDWKRNGVEAADIVDGVIKPMLERHFTGDLLIFFVKKFSDRLSEDLSR